MTKLQAIVTIVFCLSILTMAVAGQAKIGVLILIVALIASVITVLYGLAKRTHRDGSQVNQFDWR